MSASICVGTGGAGVKVLARLYLDEELGFEGGYVALDTTDASVTISFDRWDEMIEFCRRHNIKYIDDRPGRGRG